MPFFQDTTNLEPEDMLILYTDGLIEARGKDGFFGEQRLVEFLSGIEKITIQEMPQAIFKEVMKYSEGLLSDDLALLVLGYNRQHNQYVD
jgi:sigma-B regulation protein RsbU (phosphoserine phosphatase)